MTPTPTPPQKAKSVQSTTPSLPRTMFDKLWDSHVVVPQTADTPAVLYIDLHLIHEVTSPQAFSALRERGLKVRRPERTLATMDHSTPTTPTTPSSSMSKASLPVIDASAMKQLDQMRANCKEFGIDLFDMGSAKRGIVHVIGPELGATRPGMTIVCGDSHTSTHGAFGALAFGIGTSEVAMVLATQCVLQSKPRTLALTAEGALGDGVTAKDLILAIIGKLGVAGGTGHVIEYRGSGIRGLSMDGRMTVCNMSIEAGARAGMIAPDETTFEYLKGRERSPKGAAWDEAKSAWRGIATDAGAAFDREIKIDASAITPMITWGTTPAMSVPIDGAIPSDVGAARAREYMGVDAGRPVKGLPVDVVFIGSCTNARISDLRAAAAAIKGKKVAPSVRMLVVPGSEAVKAQAEREGLAKVFVEAGAEWREPGCSMCIAMNGDRVAAGKYAVSTSNRNFEGRQGSGARTLLASPITAAAAAIAGRVADPRELELAMGGA